MYISDNIVFCILSHLVLCHFAAVDGRYGTLSTLDHQLRKMLRVADICRISAEE